MAATLHTPSLVFASAAAVLGESPVWDERTGTLYWVDIERGDLHHCGADGSQQGLIPLGERIGCVALRRDQPGFIAGLERSIVLLTLNPLKILPISPIDPHPFGNRCNDGKCDSEGRFWFGTCDMEFRNATGWFFRFDASGALTRTAGPMICTNGPAFSPDGRTIYCVDSYGRAVYQYAMSPSGELSGQTLFKRFEHQDSGYPDGLTCDLSGCVWIAQWGASRVSRFSPQGELLDVIQLPVAQPTSCTFGGAGLNRLFITTASQGLAPESNANRLAGALFAVDLKVGGLPAARFDG